MRLLRPPRNNDPGAKPATTGGTRADAVTGALFGAWSATRWQYSNAAGRSIDVVCDLGGSVSLSLSPDAFILAFNLPGRRSGPGLSGVLAIEGEDLVLDTDGYFGTQTVRFRQFGDTLSLSSSESAWDFDEDGVDETAEFVGVLVRL